MKRYVPILAFVIAIFAFVLLTFALLNPMTDQGANQFGYTQRGQRVYNAGKSISSAPAWYASTSLLIPSLTFWTEDGIGHA